MRLPRLKVESCYSLSLSLLSYPREGGSLRLGFSRGSFTLVLVYNRERERKEGEVPTGMTFVYINVRFEL